MSEKKDQNTSLIKGIGLTSLGWELAVPIFGGVLIGYQIDRLLRTQYIFTLVLLFLGIFTGYYNLYKRIELEMLKTKAAKNLIQQDHKENGVS